AASPGSLIQDQVTTAWIGQVTLFLLTLMLSTMVLSQLIEEKSNKIIEVIAAAMPIDAMFVGKLFAMLAASVLALLVWLSAGALWAAIFPLSSPMAMLARAAERSDLWLQLAAILWQSLWVAVIVRLGAKLFRKTVLKSGPRLAWWRFGRAS